MGTGVSPSHSIVTQIAAAEGIDPTELRPPLHAVVDPVALDRLVDSSESTASDDRVRIEFEYCGYTVRVDGTGDVDVIGASQLGGSNPDSAEESHGD